MIKRCDNCNYYYPIDSGYGYCKRFPPKDKIISIIPKIKTIIEYQIVMWDCNTCGEFLKENKL